MVIDKFGSLQNTIAKLAEFCIQLKRVAVTTIKGKKKIMLANTFRHFNGRNMSYYKDFLRCYGQYRKRKIKKTLSFYNA